MPRFDRPARPAPLRPAKRFPDDPAAALRLLAAGTRPHRRPSGTGAVRPAPKPRLTTLPQSASFVVDWQLPPPHALGQESG